MKDEKRKESRVIAEMLGKINSPSYCLPEPESVAFILQCTLNQSNHIVRVGPSNIIFSFLLDGAEMASCGFFF